ncbi:MipA/OmpV family protein [Alteromonas sediminis]|uniref:MipA/OmpV family protein n=1 Tax=Alteromonas sediminis TaxID=2259342 RepID=A0A3N5YKY6_9ALTE|nr:MipA/OmpV family protein [Alteromonas sediminis]RPJ65681.1 MipA/OmpV family protein [Alteromonas sediminis]
MPLRYKRLGHVILLLLLSTSSSASFARCESNCDNSEVTWQFDVGLAISYRAGIVDSLEYEEGQSSLSLLLAGGVYYEDFFLESSPLSQHPFTIGYTLASSNDYSINLVMESWFSEINPEDAVDDSLEGLTVREGSLEVGLEYTRAFTKYDLRVRLLHDALSRHKGSIATIELARPLFFKSTLVIPSIGATFISSPATQYYYGVSTAEAKPGRLAYSPNDAVVTSARIYIERPMSKSWSLVGYGGYAVLSSAIANSPIVSPRSDTYYGGVGVLWTF